MKIGIVLSSTPSYSETFFISKIKGLQKHGFEVVLFVNHTNNGLKHLARRLTYLKNCLKGLVRGPKHPNNFAKVLCREQNLSNNC